MTERPDLFTELRRRRVFRTAAAYLAGAFVLLQVADLTFEPLGLPASAYRALIIVAAVGFPVAVLLSWFFDVRRAESRPHLRMKSGWALAGFVIICAAAMTYGVLRHWKRADYDDAAVIAVLPFNITGAPELAYLESGLVEMLSRNIDGAAGLRAVSPDMVLTHAKQKSATTPTQQLADKMSARYLVSGSVAQAGQNIRITATLHDFEKAASPPLVVEGTAEQLFVIVDRLSAQLLAATRKGQDARLSQSAAVTTSSLAALRKYLAGEDYYRRTVYDSASISFSEATELDSTFALAYYRQSLAEMHAGKFFPAREAMDRGLRHSARLTERDQSLVQALAATINGKSSEAEARYRELLRQYPGDLEATYLLAQTLFTFNPMKGRSPREAIPLIDQVASADPEFFCPI